MLKTSRRLLAVIGSGLAVACGDSKGPSEPTEVPPLDIAAAIGQMASTTLTGFPGTRSFIGVPVGAASPAVQPSNCAYQSSVHGFVCPTTNAGGLTFALSFFVADAAGQPQSQWDNASTASIRTVVDTKGTIVLTSVTPNSVVTIDDHSDMTMSGLLTPLRTLNGLSKTHDIIVAADGSSRTVVDATTTTSNVVIPASSSAGSAWPRSGTISLDLTSTSSAVPSLAVHAVITFNGTSVVTVATTVSGVTATCRIDLSGKTAPAC